MNHLMRALDEVDYLLLAFLQNKVTRPAQLSEKLKKHGHELGANACRKRIEDLEHDGYIRRYVAILDPAQLDLSVVSFLLVRIGDKDKETFKAKFIADPRVLEFHEVLGQADFILKIRVNNNEEAIQFSEDVNPFVGTVESLLGGRVHKESTELPLPILDAMK